MRWTHVYFLSPKLFPRNFGHIQLRGGAHVEEGNQGEIHARVQTRSGAHGRGCAQPRRARVNAVQLGQAEREGHLLDTGTGRAVNAEQMELAGLRAELSRVQIESEILKRRQRT